MRITILPNHSGRHVFHPSSLVYPSIDHDDIKLVMVLQDLDILQGVPINQDAVGEVPFLDLAKLVRAHTQLRDAGGRRNDGFHRREVEELHEVCEIPRISPVRRPREAVVATGKDDDAAAVHLADTEDGRVELSLVAGLLCLFVWVAEGGRIMDCCNGQLVSQSLRSWPSDGNKSLTCGD